MHSGIIYLYYLYTIFYQVSPQSECLSLCVVSYSGYWGGTEDHCWVSDLSVWGLEKERGRASRREREM